MILIEDKIAKIALLTGVDSSKKNYYTELKKTVEQLEKKNMQLEILNGVMKSIKVNMRIDEILNNLIDKLSVIIEFERFSFLMMKNGSLSLSFVYPTNSVALELSSVIPKEHSLYWSAINERRIRFEWLERETTFSEKQYLTVHQLKSILVLPLFSKNNEIGVLTIGRKSLKNWDKDDLHFLEQLTDHLAASIENVQLYNEVLQAKQEWENTFKAVDDKIIIYDQNLNILQVNDSAQQLYKIKPKSELEQLNRVCLTVAENTLLFLQADFQEIHLQDQSIFELTTYPILNESKEPQGVIAYLKDVTEKRKMETQLIHSGKLAAIGEMAAGVAHELNSPLTAILGNAQLLLRKVQAGDPNYILLTDIKNCGDRCKHIIKSLLTFSRQDEYSFDKFSLNDAIAQVLNLLNYQLEKSSISLKVELDKQMPLLDGNQPQIEQIIINLLLNAKDALEPNANFSKQIFIQTYVDDDNVCLKVTDNGIGIEKERLTAIFHPFHTTKEFEKGTGLGLSVSLGIARAHGGHIGVDSELHNGSVFILTLPLTQREAEVNK
ncbi:ATP-binding protein [Alkalihalobacillus sp. 1P02AB]|uniref:GAF domain-containing sensor histidine kinase n=1 Tax=Alkalihalobacillus sp. 1P02AB TaxID=3132260 RepID=UPI0039A42CBD